MHEITTRRVGGADTTFLRELSWSLRAPVLGQAGVPPQVVEALVQQQYEAQLHGYTSTFGADGHQVILVDGTPAGRIWTAESDGSVHVLDISLLPSKQGLGIGTTILRRLLSEASRQHRSVSLRVARENGDALRWYLRLGFVVVETLALDHRLEFDPAPEDSTEADR